MQRRAFTLLVAATVVSVAAAAVALTTGAGTVSKAAQGQRALPDLAPNLAQLAWVRINRGTMKANFSQVGGKWGLVEKGNYPIDEKKMRRLLLALADLTLIEPKTQRPELYSRLDVDDPVNGKATEITLQDRTGKVVGQIIVGRSRPNRLGMGNDGVYVRRIGENRAWLARGAVDVGGDAVDWLQRRIVDIPAGRIASMVFAGDQGVAVISRKSAEAKFAVDNAPGDAKFKDEAALAMPAAALERLDLTDVKPAADQPVPDTGVDTAAFTTLDGLTVRIKLFERDKQEWVLIEAAGKGDEAKALNDRVGRWAYAIPVERAKLLRTKLADLLQPAGGS